MPEAGFPSLALHRKVHALFIRRLNEYQRRFEAEEDIAVELRGILERWFFHHINTEASAPAPAASASGLTAGD